ncbi:MAG: hypothetical protein R3B68_12835 [Phycisphaerales bacterium]
MILYLASDLLWATRIKRAAEDLRIAARPVRSLEMLEARLGESRGAAAGENPKADHGGGAMGQSPGAGGGGGGGGAAASEPITGVILDLESPDAALDILGRLRGPSATDADRAIRILAFAPHVKTDLMARAKAAGADRVLPRGAFDGNLGRLLGELAGG